MRTLLIALFVVLPPLAACSDSSSMGAKGEASDISAERSYSRTASLRERVPASGLADPIGDRQLIRNARISLLVQDGASAAEGVASLAAELEGFIAEEDSVLRQGSERRTYTLRIPAARLDEGLERLARLAERVLHRALSTDDVTEQVVDVEARLNTLRATESELLELLTQAREEGRELKDVVAIHTELGKIRGQVEQFEGRRRKLANQVALATVRVELVLEASAAALQSEPWQPLAFAGKCWGYLLGALKVLVEIVMLAVIVILPLGVLVGAPFYVLFKRSKSDSLNAPSTSES